jgi:hypothetical protein
MSGKPAPRLLLPEHFDAATGNLLDAQSLLMTALEDHRRDPRNATLGRAYESMRRAQLALNCARPMRQREATS